MPVRASVLRAQDRSMIIADTVVERVARDLRATIHSVPSARANDGRVEHPSSPSITAPPVKSVSLGQSGYIQTIDYEALVAVARRHDAVLRVSVRAGHFVLSRGEHVVVHSMSTLD